MPLQLDDLSSDAQVTGLIGREAVRIVSVQMMGEADFVCAGVEVTNSDRGVCALR